MGFDPHTVPLEVLAFHLRDAVQGADTPAEAEERIKERFSLQPAKLQVTICDASHFNVLVQFSEASKVELVCEH